jgi:hypothetical protein
MGLEPANSYGIGMSRQNSLGLLKAIEPQQTIEYQVEIGILEGSDDIDNFEREISVIAPVTPEFASILV